MRAHRPARLVVAALVLAVTVLAAAACSPKASPSSTTTTAQPPSGASGSTTTTVAIVGDPVNQYTLSLGDCFNHYDVGKEAITTRSSCDGPHQREVYATIVHPAPFGDPWPGDDALQRYGLRLCYQSFASFVGVIYELSELGIGVLTPPQLNWEDSRARYRGITCYLARNDARPLVGSMRGKAI